MRLRRAEIDSRHEPHPRRALEPPDLRTAPATAPPSARSCILRAVTENWRALKLVPEDLQDREIVLAAVRQAGKALRYASKGLLADRVIVLEAVKQDGYAIRFASDELRADREVVLEAVKQYGDVLCYASQGLRADREVVLMAVNQCGDALQHASKELRADPDFMLAAWLRIHWSHARLLFLGHREGVCLFSILPIELVHGVLLPTLLRTLGSE